MTTHTFHWSVLGLVGFVMCGTVGCTRWMELKPPSAGLQETVPHLLPSNERVPLVIDSFHLSRNGSPQSPSADVERRILTSVRATSLFSTAIAQGEQPGSLGDKIVSARLTVDETIEPHSALSALKGMIIGGSMFLLSPFLNLEYDYTAKVGLELERWDGQLKHYEASSSGRVHYKLFGATPVMIDELKGQVTEACLADLTRQLVRDTNFYMASSASLPKSGIRTVLVKSRGSPASSSALSITSIASAPSQ